MNEWKEWIEGVNIRNEWKEWIEGVNGRSELKKWVEGVILKPSWVFIILFYWTKN